MSGQSTDVFDRVADDGEIRSRTERIRDQYQATVVAPFKILWADSRGKAGLSIVFAYLFMGTAGVLITRAPTPGAGPRLAGPLTTQAHPLGTTNTGADLLAGIVHATPLMLQMMFAGAIFTAIIGVSVGLVSGFTRGLLDQVLMTLTDIALTIPGLPLIIVVSVFLKPEHPVTIGIVLSLTRWAGLARQLRSEVLSLRHESYVEASQAMGIGLPSILVRDIAPNVMPFTTVRFIFAARGVLFASVGLYFLGILPYTNQNWGVMINVAYKWSGSLSSLDAAHLLVVPTLTVIFLTFGLTLLAQSTDQVFNPRLRAEYESPEED